MSQSSPLLFIDMLPYTGLLHTERLLTGPPLARRYRGTVGEAMSGPTPSTEQHSGDTHRHGAGYKYMGWVGGSQTSD